MLVNDAIGFRPSRDYQLTLAQFNRLRFTDGLSLFSFLSLLTNISLFHIDKSKNRPHNQLNEEINSTLLSSRSSEENNFADEQYGSVAMKEKHGYSNNSRGKLTPNRVNHYIGDENAGKENYDDSTESQRILLCSEKQDYFENRDSVHKTFYGRMNQVSIQQKIHEIHFLLTFFLEIKLLHGFLCIKLSKIVPEYKILWYRHCWRLISVQHYFYTVNDMRWAIIMNFLRPKCIHDQLSC